MLIAISRLFEGRGADCEVVAGVPVLDHPHDFAVWTVATGAPTQFDSFIAFVAELELGGPRVGRPRVGCLEVGCPGSVVPGVSRLWSGLGPWQAPFPRPSRNRHQLVGFGIPADEAFVGRE